MLLPFLSGDVKRITQAAVHECHQTTPFCKHSHTEKYSLFCGTYNLISSFGNGLNVTDVHQYKIVVRYSFKMGLHNSCIMSFYCRD